MENNQEVSMNNFDEQYDLEMESIYMAWQCGTNYPEDKLSEAILYIQSRENNQEVGR